MVFIVGCGSSKSGIDYTFSTTPASDIQLSENSYRTRFIVIDFNKGQSLLLEREKQLMFYTILLDTYTEYNSNLTSVSTEYATSKTIRKIEDRLYIEELIIEIKDKHGIYNILVTSKVAPLDGKGIITYPPEMYDKNVDIVRDAYDRYFSLPGTSRRR